MEPPSFCCLATLVGAFTVGPLAAFLAFFVSSILVATCVRPSLRLAAPFVRPADRLAAPFVRPADRLAAPFVRLADRLAAAIVSTAYRLVAAVRMGLAIVRGSDGIVYVRCPGIGSLGRRRRTWNVVPVRWPVRTGLPGCHHSMAFELPGSRSCRDGRPTMVYRGQQRAVPACSVFVLDLFGGCYGMPLVHGSLFRGIWPDHDTARAAVVADPIHGDVIDDSPVDVGRVNDGSVDVRNRGVVGEDPVIPVPADVISPDVTVTIVNSAVEADMRTPVPGVPVIHAGFITPITRRP